MAAVFNRHVWVLWYCYFPPATLQETFHPKLSEHFLIIKFNIPLTSQCEVILLFPVY